ncbi:hypothetical protein ADUPG1_012598, partial [Aduncisulcus paluster]
SVPTSFPSFTPDVLSAAASSLTSSMFLDKGKDAKSLSSHSSGRGTPGAFDIGGSSSGSRSTSIPASHSATPPIVPSRMLPTTTSSSLPFSGGPIGPCVLGYCDSVGCDAVPDTDRLLFPSKVSINDPLPSFSPSSIPEELSRGNMRISSILGSCINPCKTDRRFGLCEMKFADIIGEKGHSVLRNLLLVSLSSLARQFLLLDEKNTSDGSEDSAPFSSPFSVLSALGDLSVVALPGKSIFSVIPDASGCGSVGIDETEVESIRKDRISSESGAEIEEEDPDRIVSSHSLANQLAQRSASTRFMVGVDSDDSEKMIRKSHSLPCPKEMGCQPPDYCVFQANVSGKPGAMTHSPSSLCSCSRDRSDVEDVIMHSMIIHRPCGMQRDVFTGNVVNIECADDISHISDGNVKPWDGDKDKEERKDPVVKISVKECDVQVRAPCVNIVIHLPAPHSYDLSLLVRPHIKVGKQEETTEAEEKEEDSTISKTEADSKKPQESVSRWATFKERAEQKRGELTTSCVDSSDKLGRTILSSFVSRLCAVPLPGCAYPVNRVACDMPTVFSLIALPLPSEEMKTTHKDDGVGLIPLAEGRSAVLIRRKDMFLQMAQPDEVRDARDETLTVSISELVDFTHLDPTDGDEERLRYLPTRRKRPVVFSRCTGYGWVEEVESVDDQGEACTKQYERAPQPMILDALADSDSLDKATERVQLLVTDVTLTVSISELVDFTHLDPTDGDEERLRYLPTRRKRPVVFSRCTGYGWVEEVESVDDQGEACTKQYERAPQPMILDALADSDSLDKATERVQLLVTDVVRFLEKIL